MPCPYFEENRLCRCRAVRGLLVPSVYERERYCRTAEPRECPTWQARSRRHGPLPEEVYYALWLPLLPDGASATAGLGGVPDEHASDDRVCG